MEDYGWAGLQMLYYETDSEYINSYFLEEESKKMEEEEMKKKEEEDRKKKEEEMKKMEEEDRKKKEEEDRKKKEEEDRKKKEEEDRKKKEEEDRKKKEEEDRQKKEETGGPPGTSAGLTDRPTDRLTVTVTVFLYCVLHSKWRYWSSYNIGYIATMVTNE